METFICLEKATEGQLLTNAVKPSRAAIGGCETLTDIARSYNVSQQYDQSPA